MSIHRLWPSTNGPASGEVDATDYTLGVEFFVTSACKLNAYFFWVATGMSTGARSFRLYSVNAGGGSGSAVSGSDITSGTLIAGQWNRVPLLTPIDLTPNQRYRACVLVTTASPKYASTSDYWNTGGGSAGIINGPLNAPNGTNAEGNDQCSFVESSVMAFPSSSFQFSNYWIDVEVETVAEPLAEVGNTIPASIRMMMRI